MSFGSKDAREGAGNVAHLEIDVLTRERPTGCDCTWVVVVWAANGESTSRMKYRNALCTAKHPPAKKAA
jgi:hypothetical protein